MIADQNVHTTECTLRGIDCRQTPFARTQVSGDERHCGSAEFGFGPGRAHNLCAPGRQQPGGRKTYAATGPRDQRNTSLDPRH